MLKFKVLLSDQQVATAISEYVSKHGLRPDSFIYNIECRFDYDYSCASTFTNEAPKDWQDIGIAETHKEEEKPEVH